MREEGKEEWKREREEEGMEEEEEEGRERKKSRIFLKVVRWCVIVDSEVHWET